MHFNRKGQYRCKFWKFSGKGALRMNNQIKKICFNISLYKKAVPKRRKKIRNTKDHSPDHERLKDLIKLLLSYIKAFVKGGGYQDALHNQLMIFEDLLDYLRQKYVHQGRYATDYFRYSFTSATTLARQVIVRHGRPVHKNSFKNIETPWDPVQKTYRYKGIQLKGTWPRF